jgi:hypothetical protein
MAVADQGQAYLQQQHGAGDRLSTASDPPNTLVDVILRETQYLYSLVLLITFVSLAAWYSVFNAKKEEDIVQSKFKGPGGKPLPITKRKKRTNGERKLGPHFGTAAKIVFRFLAAIVFLTYLASALLMLVHAFWYEDPYKWSKEGLPWAGQWSVVCLRKCTFSPVTSAGVAGFVSLGGFSILLLTSPLNRFTSLVLHSFTSTFSCPCSIGARVQMSSISSSGYWASSGRS